VVGPCQPRENEVVNSALRLREQHTRLDSGAQKMPTGLASPLLNERSVI